MTIKSAVQPADLGADFDIGTIVPLKITIIPATDATAGKVRLATAGDIASGATDVAVTPAEMANYVASAIGAIPPDVNLSALSYDTGTRVLTATDTDGSTAAAGLPASTDSVQGLVELATDAETLAGVDTSRALTAANLRSMELSEAELFAEAAGTDHKIVTQGTLKGHQQFTPATVSMAFGVGANAGAYSASFGWNAGLSGTLGSSCTFIGSACGQGNVGNVATCVGESAGKNNTGLSLTAFAANAGLGNIGNYVNCFGVNAGKTNTADHVSIVGTDAGVKNSGRFLCAFGTQSSYFNSVQYVSAYGYFSASLNTGANLVSIGSLSGFGNRSYAATFVGHDTRVRPVGASPATLALPNVLTIAGHGIPVGEYTVIEITATTYPAPQVGPFQLSVLSTGVNTLQAQSTFTSVGAGLVAAIQPVLTNVIGLGSQAWPDASNQCRIGNAALSEVRTAATVFAAGFTVVSDQRLKREIREIDRKAAILFSRQIKFVDYFRIRSPESIMQHHKAVAMQHGEMLAQARDELNALRSKFGEKREGNQSEAIVQALAKIARIEKDSPKEPDLSDDALKFDKRMAGVLAQQVQELIEKTGYGDFLVSEGPDGYLEVDIQSLNIIINAGLQARLEDAGI